MEICGNYRLERPVICTSKSGFPYKSTVRNKFKSIKNMGIRVVYLDKYSSMEV